MNFYDFCKALFRLGVHCLQYVWHLLTDSLRIAVQRWYVVVPIMVLFAGIGIWRTDKTHREYKAETLVMLNGPSRDDITAAVDRIDKATDYEMLAEQTLVKILGVSDEVAGGMTGMECFPVVDYNRNRTVDQIDYSRRHKLSDSINILMPNYLMIRLRMRKPQDLPILNEAVFAYLNGLPGMQEAFEAHRNILTDKSAFYHKQLLKMDSIASAFYFKGVPDEQIGKERNWSSSPLTVGRKEMRMLTPQMEQLAKLAEQTDYELTRCTAPVTATVGFTVDPVPQKGRLSFVLLYLFAGYVAGCVSAYGVKRRKELRAWLWKE